MTGRRCRKHPWWHGAKKRARKLYGAAKRAWRRKHPKTKSGKFKHKR